MLTLTTPSSIVTERLAPPVKVAGEESRMSSGFPTICQATLKTNSSSGSSTATASE